MFEIIDKKLKQLFAEFREPYPIEVNDMFEQIDQRTARLNSIRFVSPEDPLEVALPNFEFYFRLDNAPAELILTCSWMVTLEEELYRRRLKVSTHGEEAYRSGTRLLSNLRLPDIQYGKGYTSQVLWRYLDARFGNIPQVREILDNMAHYRPYESVHALDCQNYIKSSIDGLGNSLILQLHYNEKEAFSILVGAIIYMLDKRYNITLGKILFPNNHRK